MEELSIEEKARRYDEAVKKVNDYYEGKTKTYSDVDKTLDYLFPELKESEDEMVRKHLLKHFSNKTKEEWNGMPVKNIIVWLEKKGEQKPAWSEDDEYNLNWVIRDYERAMQTAISSVWEGHFKIIVDWLKTFKEKMKGE